MRLSAWKYFVNCKTAIIRMMQKNRCLCGKERSYYKSDFSVAGNWPPMFFLSVQRRDCQNVLSADKIIHWWPLFQRRGQPLRKCSCRSQQNRLKSYSARSQWDRQDC